MLTYLEVTDFSLLILVICQNEKLNFFDYLITSKLEIQKQNPETWLDIKNLSQFEDSLFEESKNLAILIDLKNLIIDEKTALILKDLSEQKSNYYLYTTEDKKLTADQKKLLKSNSIEYLNLKSIDKNLASDLVSKYLEFYKISDSKLKFDHLISQSLSYQELIDNLDFVFLAADQKQALESIIKPENLPIFMYSFNTDNLARDIPKWLNRLHPDDLQLHLSLLFTKLDKQKNSLANVLQNELILTDLKIKTISKVEPSVWLKYWFYRAANI